MTDPAALPSVSLSAPTRLPTGLRAAVPIGLASIVVFTVYFAFALSMGCETSGDAARDAYYNRLADGLISGHTYLDKPVPARLLAAPDPYDRAAVAESRGLPYSPTCIHDLSYYRGHLYLYFSVVQALLLFVPFHLSTGAYLSQQAASALFLFGGFASLASILASIWRRFFPRVSAWVAGIALLAVGLIPGTSLLLQRADVYEVPISGAFFSRRHRWSAYGAR